PFRPPARSGAYTPPCPADIFLAAGQEEAAMGLLDVINGMQQAPRGPSTPSSQSSGGMSPMTMAILGLLPCKTFKHLTASQPGATTPPPTPVPAPSGGSVASGRGGGGL